MNRVMKQIAFVILTFAGLTTAVPQSPDVPGLFQQLQAPGTTDRAAGQLLELGKQSKAAREFLAAHLPAFVANGPADPAGPWLNAVHLVGGLKLAEAAPALERWIGLDNGGTVGFTISARLGNNPAGKALSQIGDPAVPTLIKAFQHVSLDDRSVAAKALRLIGSAAAKDALQAQLGREPDSGLRAFIKTILDHWKPLPE